MRNAVFEMKEIEENRPPVGPDEATTCRLIGSAGLAARAVSGGGASKPAAATATGSPSKEDDPGAIAGGSVIMALPPFGPVGGWEALTVAGDAARAPTRSTASRSFGTGLGAAPDDATPAVPLAYRPDGDVTLAVPARLPTDR
jgi:hypothetical protein